MMRQWVLEQRARPEEGPNARSTLGNAAVNMDGTLLFQMLMDGVLSTAVNRGTGIAVDIGGRFGPGGNRFFSDLLGDKDMFTILTGATGSALREITAPARRLDGYSPTGRALASVRKQDGRCREHAAW
jgi:hypothetical protein